MLGGRPAGPPPRPLDAATLAAGLIAVAEDLAGEFAAPAARAHPAALHGAARLRRRVDLQRRRGGGTYRKEADIGVACQSGRVFPLTEGITGLVVARRAPVWFDRYEQVRGGHVAPEERATLRGVIGVPLEWRGRVTGACIVFSRDDRRAFGPDDAELLGLFARHAAVPVSLHLDHCPEREVISRCLRRGWNSVLFDGSRLPVAENLRQTVDVVAEARSYGAHVEGEIEAITGVEDDIGSDEEAHGSRSPSRSTSSGRRGSTSSRPRSAMRMACTAPSRTWMRSASRTSSPRSPSRSPCTAARE